MYNLFILKSAYEGSIYFAVGEIENALLSSFPRFTQLIESKVEM